MICGYGFLRTAAVGIWQHVSWRPAQRYQLLSKSPADLRRVVLATVPGCHFGFGSGSKPNLWQIGSRGCQFNWTVNSCPGKISVRRIHRRAQALLADGIATGILWVPRYSGIPGNEVADFPVNLALDASRSTALERLYTSASNRARRIAKGRSAANAKWEADMCSKHCSYRLKGRTGTKRPVPMTSVKSLRTRFYRLQCGQAPTGVYIKRCSHWEDDICLWCAWTAAQTRDHLLRHCSRWRDQRKALWKRWERWPAGKLAAADRCRCLRCFPWKSAINWWWTSWWLLKSGWSRANNWRYGMGRTQRLTLVRGAAAAGEYLFVSFLFVCLSFSSHLSAGMKGRGVGGTPSSWLSRRRRRYQVPSYTN